MLASLVMMMIVVYVMTRARPKRGALCLSCRHLCRSKRKFRERCCLRNGGGGLRIRLHSSGFTASLDPFDASVASVTTSDRVE